MSRLRSIIPNLLSISRPILIIPFVITLSRGWTITPLALALIIVLSDYFDGLLARSWNTVTELGKILDPVADKLTTAAGAIAMIYYRGFPLWLTLVVIARDLGILLAGLILLRKKRFVPVSDLVGKVAMVVLSACLLIYLFDIAPLKQPAVILTVLTQAASVFSYGRQFRRSMAVEKA